MYSFKTEIWQGYLWTYSQIACHRCGGWATGGPTVAATSAGGPLVAHPRCAIWAVAWYQWSSVYICLYSCYKYTSWRLNFIHFSIFTWVSFNTNCIYPISYVRYLKTWDIHHTISYVAQFFHKNSFSVSIFISVSYDVHLLPCMR